MALNFVLLRRFTKFFSLLNLNLPRFESVFFRKSRSSVKFNPIKFAPSARSPQ